MQEISSRTLYMIAILEALREMGGEAPTPDVYNWLESSGHAREADLRSIQTDGGTRFKKEVRFARKELFDAGLLSSKRRGLWTLTANGAATDLTPERALAIVRSRRRRP